MCGLDLWFSVPIMYTSPVLIFFFLTQSQHELKNKLAAELEILSQRDEDYQKCSVKPKCLKPWIDPIEWVQCDGKCQLWFHLYCIGLKKEQLNEDEDYLCNVCKANDRRKEVRFD